MLRVLCVVILNITDVSRFYKRNAAIFALLIWPYIRSSFLEGKLLTLQNSVDELREKLAISQSETLSRDHDLKQVLH